MLRDSADNEISSNPPSLKAGAWKVAEAVSEAENTLILDKIMGLHQTGRSGFGNISSQKTLVKRSHGYRNLIATVVNKLDQDKDLAKAVQLHLQGYWTNWCDYIKNNLSWKTI